MADIGEPRIVVFLGTEFRFSLPFPFYEQTFRSRNLLMLGFEAGVLAMNQAGESQQNRDCESLGQPFHE